MDHQHQEDAAGLRARLAHLDDQLRDAISSRADLMAALATEQRRASAAHARARALEAAFDAGAARWGAAA